MRSSLSICALLTADPLIQFLQQFVKATAADRHERYTLRQFSLKSQFLDFVEHEKQHIDCLMVQDDPDLPHLFRQLQEQEILLPTLIVVPPTEDLAQAVASPAIAPDRSDSGMAESDQFIHSVTSAAYHSATLRLPTDQLDQLEEAIDQAISRFLKLSNANPTVDFPSEQIFDSPILVQQRRLAEKLKERLGYLGVYYKRNPQNFLRHMSQPQRQAFLQQLRGDYRDIILSYFSNAASLNEKIDNFVNLAFFADISVSQIVEIHMELMDEFSKQLKLEGRSDEVLLDYRLTLIDTIAHLCEMYRRSISRGS